MTHPAEPVLRVVDLVKYYRAQRSAIDILQLKKPTWIQAVDGLSLELQNGEILALLGESGCGKSTLARVLMHLEDPTRGAILFAGRDVSRLSGTDKEWFRRRVQIVFQNPYEAFDPRFSLEESLRRPLELHHIGRDAVERREKIIGALQATGLVPPRDFLSRYPHELSGGQLQRIAVIRVMLLQPEILIADEPVSMLDISVRADVLNQLLDLRDQTGAAIIVITHDIAVARYLADRIAVMYLGRLVEVGPTDSVISAPMHPYTQALIASTPKLTALERQNQAAIEVVGEPPKPVNLPPGCRFAARCPVAFDRCRKEEPELLPVADSHVVACHLHGASA
jgi:peptide/nickel transport system ATP-binding protein